MVMVMIVVVVMMMLTMIIVGGDFDDDGGGDDDDTGSGDDGDDNAPSLAGSLHVRNECHLAGSLLMTTMLRMPMLATMLMFGFGCFSVGHEKQIPPLAPQRNSMSRPQPIASKPT